MFATSVAIPCLPTCFFLDVIKEIRDKNTSFSIYPQKKKKQAAETYIFYGRNGSKLRYTMRIYRVNRGPAGVSLADLFAYL